MHPIAYGILAGLGAGSVFIVAEIIISGALSKPFLDPLRINFKLCCWGGKPWIRRIHSTTDVVVGLISNIVLSGLFGLIFVFILMAHIVLTTHKIVFVAGIRKLSAFFFVPF
jgi:hypothetical protein